MIPGFADAGGGTFMSVEGLPEHTLRHMVMFMGKLRGMYSEDPLAFEVCVYHTSPRSSRTCAGEREKPTCGRIPLRNRPERRGAWECSDVWVAKDDGSDIVRATAVVGVGIDYDGNITVRLGHGDGATVTLAKAGRPARIRPRTSTAS